MGRYLLSLRELAAVLGKDVSTVHRLARDCRLPFDVIDSMGVKVVRRVDVEAFLGCPLEDAS